MGSPRATYASPLALCGQDALLYRFQVLAVKSLATSQAALHLCLYNVSQGGAKPAHQRVLQRGKRFIAPTGSHDLQGVLPLHGRPGLQPACAKRHSGPRSPTPLAQQEARWVGQHCAGSMLEPKWLRT